MSKPLSESGLFYLFCSVAGFLLITLLDFFRNCFSQEVLFTIASTLPVFAELAVMFWLLKKNRSFNLLGLKTTTLQSLLLSILLTILTYPFLTFMSGFCEFLMPKSSFNLSPTSLSVFHNLGPVMGLLILAVLPGVSEELIFRGYIFGVLRKRSFMCALIMSTLSFAIIHGNFNQAVYTALFGVLLCLIREISGSVFPCMVCHTLFNSVSVCHLYSEPRYDESKLPVELSQAISSPGFSDFWLANIRLFVTSMIGLSLAVITYGILKERNNFTFDFKANKKYPFITGGFVAGWVASIVLGII